MKKLLLLLLLTVTISNLNCMMDIDIKSIDQQWMDETNSISHKGWSTKSEKILTELISKSSLILNKQLAYPTANLSIDNKLVTLTATGTLDLAIMLEYLSFRKNKSVGTFPQFTKFCLEKGALSDNFKNLLLNIKFSLEKEKFSQGSVFDKYSDSYDRMYKHEKQLSNTEQFWTDMIDRIISAAIEYNNLEIIEKIKEVDVTFVRYKGDKHQKTGRKKYGYGITKKVPVYQKEFPAQNSFIKNLSKVTSEDMLSSIMNALIKDDIKDGRISGVEYKKQTNLTPIEMHERQEEERVDEKLVQAAAKKLTPHNESGQKILYEYSQKPGSTKEVMMKIVDLLSNTVDNIGIKALSDVLPVKAVPTSFLDILNKKFPIKSDTSPEDKATLIKQAQALFFTLTNNDEYMKNISKKELIELLSNPNIHEIVNQNTANRLLNNLFDKGKSFKYLYPDYNFEKTATAQKFKELLQAAPASFFENTLPHFGYNYIKNSPNPLDALSFVVKNTQLEPKKFNQKYIDQIEFSENKNIDEIISELTQKVKDQQTLQDALKKAINDKNLAHLKTVLHIMPSDELNETLQEFSQSPNIATLIKGEIDRKGGIVEEVTDNLSDLVNKYEQATDPALKLKHLQDIQTILNKEVTPPDFKVALNNVKSHELFKTFMQKKSDQFTLGDALKSITNKETRDAFLQAMEQTSASPQSFLQHLATLLTFAVQSSNQPVIDVLLKKNIDPNMLMQSLTKNKTNISQKQIDKLLENTVKENKTGIAKILLDTVGFDQNVIDENFQLCKREEMYQAFINSTKNKLKPASVFKKHQAILGQERSKYYYETTQLFLAIKDSKNADISFDMRNSEGNSLADIMLQNLEKINPDTRRFILQNSTPKTNQVAFKKTKNQNAFSELLRFSKRGIHDDFIYETCSKWVKANNNKQLDPLMSAIKEGPSGVEQLTKLYNRSVKENNEILQSTFLAAGAKKSDELKALIDSLGALKPKLSELSEELTNVQ